MNRGWEEVLMVEEEEEEDGEYEEHLVYVKRICVF
jgi:hypothetical protein